MGWLHERFYEQHEGYAAFVTSDGRLAGSSNIEGVVIWRDSGEEQVPWAQVVAWQAACVCGWVGSRWERAATTPGEYGGLDSEDAYLPDGSTVEDAARAEWEAHVDPLDRLAVVRDAAAAAGRARNELDQAVVRARAKPQLSWEEIGRAAGMTKQSAHEKWARLTTEQHIH